MKKIIVPCDFSIPSINAFRFALDIASKSQGEIHLLHVIEVPVLHDTLIMPVLAFEDALFKELKEKAIKEMKHLNKKYNIEGAHIVSEVLFGPVHMQINNYANEKSADLIVMGTHGASGLREFLIGSNAEKIVRTASMPVITLKDLYHGPVKHIVFPNTLETEDQEDLVQKVKMLQEFFKAHLHIVWINTPLNFTGDTHTRERLEAFAQRYMFKNYTIDVFNHVNIEEGILEFARQQKANLIAMGTHGRKGLKHLYSGSMAEDIVNHSELLVWTSVMKKDIVAIEA